MDAVEIGIVQALRTRYRGWGAREIALAGEGLEFRVFRMEARAGHFAIKVPRATVYSNDNDPHIPARALLEQEAALAGHLRSAGVLMPRVIDLQDEPFAHIVEEFVDHDDEPVRSSDLGKVLATLHRAVPPEHRLVAQGEGGMEGLLAERLCRRGATVERLTGLRLDLPDPAGMATVLGAHDRPRAMLHMDLRPENVLGRKGSIAALIDWSNALVGDPALELARAAEYQVVDERLLEAYRAGGASWSPPPPDLELLYKLDAAIMLAVVFLSEHPDPHRAHRQVARVQALAKELAEVLRPNQGMRS